LSVMQRLLADLQATAESLPPDGVPRQRTKPRGR
jgi:hypothetical protein